MVTLPQREEGGEEDVTCEDLDGAVFSTAEVAILLVCSVMDMMEEEVILLLPFEDADAKDSADLSGKMAARFGSSDPLEADENVALFTLPGGMVEFMTSSTFGGVVFWRENLEGFIRLCLIASSNF